MAKRETISIRHAQAKSLLHLLNKFEETDSKMNIRITRDNNDLYVLTIRPKKRYHIQPSGRIMYGDNEMVMSEEEFNKQFDPEYTDDELEELSQSELMKIGFNLGFDVNQINSSMSKEKLKEIILNHE